MDDDEGTLLKYYSVLVVYSVDIRTSSLCQALRSVRSLDCTVAILPFGGRDMNELVIQQAIADVINAGVTVIAAAGNDGPVFGYVKEW